jgi:cbb3-type cytochrome c oxidase subunit II
MPPGKSLTSSWQGVVLVAITYIYFLIFAQFAFLQRLATLGIAETHLRIVMAAMAIGGILFSLLTPRLRFIQSPNLRLRIGLGASSAAALFTLLPLSFVAATALSFLIGAALGVLTVTLVTNLRQWVGNRNALLKVGLGTGIGYFACNVPLLFTATPQVQAATAAILCFAALCLPLRSAPETPPQAPNPPQTARSFLLVLASFAALVWLDSAAFFIIQNTPALKSGTWQGSIHLWTNAAVHFAAALACAWFLRRKGLSFVLTGAFVALGCACLLLLSPDRILVASILYPIGVSLYSVALVAYPSLLAPVSTAAERGRQAGWIYAVAGWSASVLGIGMGQNLGYVPPAFVLASGVVILLPWLFRLFLSRMREIVLAEVVLLAAFGLNRVLQPARQTSPSSQIERGRQVYISEGCISCHSQYVRPNTSDVLMWGPAERIQEIRLQHPPLIGNRRQGPDLSQVGVRRSALWLKAHFYDPPEVSGASIMPTFAFLFRDQRGDDLVAYLESLRGADAQQHIAEVKRWQPSTVAMQAANPEEGRYLYQRYCATCHAAHGRTHSKWEAGFKRLPTDLIDGPFYDLPGSGTREGRMIRIAQMAKFGIPESDMPGHEYLSDQQIASISLWVLQNIAHPVQNQ